MSLFSDIANAIGHTIDSLAQAVGVDASVLETVVNDLDSNGVNVFSAATKLGLSLIGFLRGIVDCMNGDPHQLLLQYLIKPVRPMDDPLYQLSQQWAQMVNLHQNTAQTISRHINDLFQSNGTYSYSGPSANSLWETNHNYQEYFTALVDHAQTQQGRHTALSGSVNDYLSQMPGKVYSLSTPMAAFGVLSLETGAASSSSSVLDDPAVKWAEQAMGDTIAGGENLEENDPDPSGGSELGILAVVLIILIVLAVIFIIIVVVVAIRDAIQSYQNQQRNTKTLKQTKPIPIASMADDLSQKYGVPLSVVEDIINKNPGLTQDEYALLIEYYKKYGTYPYGVISVFTGVDQNGKSKIYFVTKGDLKHIREHGDNLQALSDEELLALIKKLLQGEPDYVQVDKSRKLIDYYYDNVDVNGKYITVIIRMSTSTPGRIISTYEEW